MCPELMRGTTAVVGLIESVRSTLWFASLITPSVRLIVSRPTVSLKVATKVTLPIDWKWPWPVTTMLCA